MESHAAGTSNHPDANNQSNNDPGYGIRSVEPWVDNYGTSPNTVDQGRQSQDSPNKQSEMPALVPMYWYLHDQQVLNPKQINRIHKRKAIREQMIARGQISETRQKYLHETRHRHAMGRVRNSNGSFAKNDPTSEATQKMDQFFP